MSYRLPEGPEYIIERLRSRGKQAYAVGGCVRDMLLGCEPKDYDITTSALPEQILEIFSDHRTVETGIKHGTVTVMRGGEPYEVTTFRIDGDYRDSRHPESVSFTESVTLDLSRRDFTMNAIAYNSIEGLIDPFDGKADIKRGVIRAVGDPVQRFCEDALRIMRAVRFASTLGFSVDEKCAEAVRELYPLLSRVSGERIRVEWEKLLAGRNAYGVISEFSEPLKFILGLDRLRLPSEEKFNTVSPEIRGLAIFELSAADPTESFTAFTERQKYDNRTKDRGRLLLSLLRISVRNKEEAVDVLLSAGRENIRDLISLRALCDRCDGGEAEIIESVLSSGAPLTLHELDLCGKDITALGISGREVGELLHLLLRKAALGEVENRRDALTALAVELTKG